MTWVDICDAWVAELTTNVAGLQAAKTHLYAPWSVEQLLAGQNEIHLAVWPQSEAEEAENFLTDGGRLAAQSYVVMVWEDASDQSARQKDSDAPNAAWLTLHEDIRSRFLELDNIRLGDDPAAPHVMDTRYNGVAFDLTAGVRVMALRFTVRVSLPAT
jgi:hypothetical protein